MELLKWKTRLAVLWLFMAIGMSSYMFLFFMEPGAIEGIIKGEIEGMQIGEGLKLYFGIFWDIPLIMAVLSLILKGSASRWPNFVLGILIAILCIIGFIESVTGGKSIAILVNYFLGFAVGALIAWYAWKWPKQEV